MITDNLLLLSDAQAVTSSANTTNTVDTASPYTNPATGVTTYLSRDLGEGDDLYLAFSVGTAFAGPSGSTVTFTAISSAAANLGSPTTIGSTDAIAVASLTAGSTFYVRINPVAGMGQRYIGGRYVVASGPMTAGAVTCHIVTDIQDGKKIGKSGFVVA